MNNNCLTLSAVNVYVPKDRVTSLHQGYGFVEFRSEEDADYVCPFFLVAARVTFDMVDNDLVLEIILVIMTIYLPL